MQQTYKKIAVLGGGVMGTVLARALVETKSSRHITVCEHRASQRKNLRKINSRIQATADISKCTDAEVLFLAIKPQDFRNIKLKINKQTLVCSIMAGIAIADIRKQLKTSKIVRMMPNMAARVGEGFTVWTATTKVASKEKKWVKNFLEKIGAQLYVKSEQQIDKATAVTGSGPAYILNTLSVFIHAAEELGFKKEEANQMVRQVLRGVNALTKENIDLAELTRQVASKGGTTEAALEVFANANLKKTWTRAITAAYKRAGKLSKQKRQQQR